jgi:cytochrome c peroxidase
MYKTSFIVVVFITISLVGTLSFSPRVAEQYISYYRNKIDRFTETEKELLRTIQTQDLNTETGKAKVKEDLEIARMQLKGIDFWLRYLEPVMYKKINGPLPVEWETEVFEKFERPYKRIGAGLTLAEVYLEEHNVIKDSLSHLIQASIEAKKTFQADSITVNLNTHHHFFLANRLFLLNLAAIYTTGFECPDPNNIIPELLYMLESVKEIYSNYDQSFTIYPLKENYLNLYNSAISFVYQQKKDPETFDHFTFLKDFVNPLFVLNQKMIREYKVISSSYNDYTLNDNCNSIFDKKIYRGQDVKGIYYSIDDEKTLVEIKNVGRLLFYDPILSGNNKRSCASCHKPTEYFNDTATATNLNFDEKRALPRNTPTLINAVYNHLLMLDGKHISLEGQARDVTTNPDEMGGVQADILKKVTSCGEYNDIFKKLVKLTPGQKTVTFNHIASAITLYYSDFSKYQSPFDRAMNQQGGSNIPISKEAIAGFNIFMSKAQCATCHFVPLFNGVKPPYV